MIFLLIMGISIFILNNAPGTITGSVSIKQLINYLNLRTLYPSVGALNAGSVLHTFKNHCGSNKNRTCDKKAAHMYHHVCTPALYQLSYTANYLRRAHVYCAKIALFHKYLL
jgi:hypothetical protein